MSRQYGTHRAPCATAIDIESAASVQRLFEIQPDLDRVTGRTRTQTRRLIHRPDKDQSLCREFQADIRIHGHDVVQCSIDRQSYSPMFQRFEDYFGGDIPHERVLRKGTPAEPAECGGETPAP